MLDLRRVGRRRISGLVVILGIVSLGTKCNDSVPSLPTGVSVTITAPATPTPTPDDPAPVARFQVKPPADSDGVIRGQSPLSVEFNMCNAVNPDPVHNEMYWAMDFLGDGTATHAGTTGAECRYTYTYVASGGAPLEVTAEICVTDRDRVTHEELHPYQCAQYRIVLSHGCQTFAATGVMQTVTVPSGVHEVTITAAGAAGGDVPLGGGPISGGRGARMAGTFPVSAGTTLQVLVGARGRSGTPAGCNCSTPGTAGGGGGGGSFVFELPATPLLVAGGGGAASVAIPGLDASTSPGSPPSNSFYSGQGGGFVHEAAPSCPFPNPSACGQPGQAAVNGGRGGLGGLGISFDGGHGGFGGGGGGNEAGGGGGGGYFGGDSANNGPASGGTSFLAPSSTQTLIGPADNMGDGSITLCF